MNNSVRFQLLLIVGISMSLFSCGSNSSNDKTDTKETVEGLNLRVMTYNIHHANPPAENEGVIDITTIAEIIKESGAELIALQELDSVTTRSNKVFQMEKLAQLLKMNFYFARAISYQGGSYGVGILSKFPIDDAQTILLPKDSDIKSEDRVLAMVKIQLPNDRFIYFASTHWDVVTNENRLLQAEKTSQVAAKLEFPVILGGDLNTKPESDPMKILRSVFSDASKKFEPTIPNNNPNRKIDHILFAKNNDFKLVDEEVIYTSKARKASDHLPYMVDLVLVDGEK